MRIISRCITSCPLCFSSNMRCFSLCTHTHTHADTHMQMYTCTDIQHRENNEEMEEKTVDWVHGGLTHALAEEITFPTAHYPSQWKAEGGRTCVMLNTHTSDMYFSKLKLRGATQQHYWSSVPLLSCTE